MILRTYFDRNNTLVYNRTVNTGKNPVAELFYGGNKNGGDFFTRYIFQFSVERIEKLINNGMYPDPSKLKHTLKMTNTGTFDKSLLGDLTADGKNRTSSFNLNLFKVNQGWHEGVGYDYDAQTYFSSIDGSVISDNPSNWVESSGTTQWSSGGVFSWSGVTIEATQSFEDGNENLEMDITDIVNGYLFSGDTNNGLGLAFDESVEKSDLINLEYVGFFTRHTQTFYEPFVETTYDVVISDDRGNFYMDKLNKLYLYVNVGGQPTNVDDLSTMTVNVNDDNDGVVSAYTSSDITHVNQGVYSIDILVPTTENGCTLFTDIWSGIVINGVSRGDIELDFEIKDSNEYYNIGSDSTIPKNYTLNISGIKDNERINRGDIRKVNVMARVPYTVNQKEVLDSLEYRLYIKEGDAEYTVIDYNPVELAFNYNYFLLDTASLVPQTYYIDIKAMYGYEVKTTKNIVRFHITNQVDKKIY